MAAIDDELRSRIIKFQSSLADLYDHNAFNSPFDVAEIDQGVRDVVEAWNEVKEYVEADKEVECPECSSTNTATSINAPSWWQCGDCQTAWQIEESDRQ